MEGSYMFCSSCGKRFETETKSSCSDCGRAVNIGEAQAIMSKSTAIDVKVNKLIIFGVLIAVLMVITIFMINRGEGSGGLSGTWVETNYNPSIRAPITIEFRGNRFTLTTFFQGDDTVWVGHYRFIQSLCPIIGFGVEEFFVESLDESFPSFWLGNADSRNDLSFWVREPWVIYSTIQQGTYSISDDRIELVFSDGRIRVFDFLRTENTLDLRISLFGEMHFIRR